jgi:hypothetical protein
MIPAGSVGILCKALKRGEVIQNRDFDDFGKDLDDNASILKEANWSDR